MAPCVATLFAIALGHYPFASLSESERCVALSSSEIRRQFVVPSELEREIILVPSQLTSEDARCMGQALHAEVGFMDNRWRVSRSGAMRLALRHADEDFLKGRIEATATRLHTQHPSGLAPSNLPETLRKARERFKLRHDLADASALVAQETTPAARLLMTLLVHLPREALANASAGAVTVFSNRPTGAERPLVADESALAEYLLAQEAFATSWGRTVDQKLVSEQDARLFSNVLFVPGPRTIQLTIARYDREPTFAIEVFGPQGQRESRASLNATGFEPPLKVVPGIRRLGRVPLSPDAQSRLSAFMLGVPSPVEMVDPVAHEPLDYFVREALLAYMKAKGYDRIVACVPDELFQAAFPCVQGPDLDLDAFADVLRDGCEEIVVNRTLVIRPKLALATEALRVDRRPFSIAVQSATRRRFGLDELCAVHAAYAGSYNHRPFLNLLRSRFALAFGAQASPNWGLPHGLLAILGELASSDRQRMLMGLPVTLSFADHPESLIELVPLVRERMADTRWSDKVNAEFKNDLAMTTTHIVASPSAHSLNAMTDNRTTVQRVGPGRIEHLGDGVVRVEEGDHLLLDSSPMSLEAFFPSVPSFADPVEWLAKHYQFFWTQEHVSEINVRLADSFLLGPYFIREKISESKAPVNLDQVPGLRLPKFNDSVGIYPIKL